MFLEKKSNLISKLSGMWAVLSLVARRLALIDPYQNKKIGLTSIPAVPTVYILNVIRLIGIWNTNKECLLAPEKVKINKKFCPKSILFRPRKTSIAVTSPTATMTKKIRGTEVMVTINNTTNTTGTMTTSDYQRTM